MKAFWAFLFLWSAPSWAATPAHEPALIANQIDRILPHAKAINAKIRNREIRLRESTRPYEEKISTKVEPWEEYIRKEKLAIDDRIRSYDWNHPTGRPWIDKIAVHDIPAVVKTAEERLEPLRRSLVDKILSLRADHIFLVRKFEHIYGLSKVGGWIRFGALKTAEFCDSLGHKLLRFSRKTAVLFSNRQV